MLLAYAKENTLMDSSLMLILHISTVQENDPKGRSITAWQWSLHQFWTNDSKTMTIQKFTVGNKNQMTIFFSHFCQCNQNHISWMYILHQIQLAIPKLFAKDENGSLICYRKDRIIFSSRSWKEESLHQRQQIPQTSTNNAKKKKQLLSKITKNHETNWKINRIKSKTSKQRNLDQEKPHLEQSKNLNFNRVRIWKNTRGSMESVLDSSTSCDSAPELSINNRTDLKFQGF